MAYSILDKLAVQNGAGHLELDKDALAVLCAYSWPGNVRELRNMLERAVLLSDSERIDARSLARFIGDGRGQRLDDEGGEQRATQVNTSVQQYQQYDEAMRDYERRFLTEALRAAGGQVTKAAAQIGMARATLYRRIVALGIDV